MPQAEVRANLSAEEVQQVAGPLDNAVVARIIATGATAAELLEAYQWLMADDHIPDGPGRPLSGRVREIYEMLEAELPDAEDR